MPERRYSRFDPEYNEQDGRLFDDFDDTDDEYGEPQRRSRFEDADKGSLFGGKKKKKKAAFEETEGRLFDDATEDDYDEDDERPRAPLAVRIFAMLVFLAVIFAAGYYGTGYIADVMGHKDRTAAENAAEKSNTPLHENRNEPAKTETHASKTAETATYKLYIPDGKNFSVRNVEIARGTVEQDMKKLLEMYFENLREAGIGSSDVTILNLFKSDNLLYLNLNSGFESNIAKLNEKQAAALITGILSTLKDNFSVKKIKFYVNNRQPNVKQPVDLSDLWEL
ncbi:MAG: GerMN domain-containing protein [Synergistaceae bacterium]|nr:GerMN domain-containing protein [Synergistaceae bacterium]